MLGTGFMISNDLLMTNNHVIPITPALHHTNENEKIIKLSACIAKFNYQKDWMDKELPVIDRKCDLTVMLSNEQLDYTIIKVEGSPGKEFGFVRLRFEN